MKNTPLPGAKICHGHNEFHRNKGVKSCPFCSFAILILLHPWSEAKQPLPVFKKSHGRDRLMAAVYQDLLPIILFTLLPCYHRLLFYHIVTNRQCKSSSTRLLIVPAATMQKRSCDDIWQIIPMPASRWSTYSNPRKRLWQGAS